MYQFVYCFTINGQLNWSYETGESLIHRVTNENQDLVTSFIEDSQAGSFIKLKSGELIFRCAINEVNATLKSA